jgi:hypothetical protein
MWEPLGIINHKEHLEKKKYIYNKTKEHKLSTKWKNIGNSIWNFIGNKWVEQKIIKAHLVGCLQNLSPFLFFSSFFFPLFFLFLFFQKLDQQFN